MKIGTQGFGDGEDRAVTAFLERPKHGHQHGLAIRACLAPVPVTVLADNHRRSYSRSAWLFSKGTPS